MGNLTAFLEANELTWKRDEDEGVSPAEVVAEAAGRLCYLSYPAPRPGGNSAYIQHIKEVGHGSVLEHTLFTFFISGVSRSLTHELVRHRAGVAFSQLSQRYVDESVAEYVIPGIIAADAELTSLWQSAVSHSHHVYGELVQAINVKLHDRYAFHSWKFLPPDATATDARKCARQAARSVLPNATESKIAFTANARALRHVFEQRGSIHAEPEIRRLAYALWLIAAADSPHLFGDYTATPHTDGTYILDTKYRKV